MLSPSPIPIPSPNPKYLFAYGTLGPDRFSADLLNVWQADAVRGRLFDLGPYPVLVDWDDPTADWVEGHIRPVDLQELLDVLDPYEGTDSGLFRRLTVTTLGGFEVWIYVFPHPLPAGAVGPIRRWNGSRVDPVLGNRAPSEPRRQD